MKDNSIVIIVFLVFGFVISFVGVEIDSPLLYVGIGWEIVSAILPIFFGESFWKSLDERREKRQLKRNSKFAVEIQQGMDKNWEKHTTQEKVLDVVGGSTNPEPSATVDDV